MVLGTSSLPREVIGFNVEVPICTLVGRGRIYTLNQHVNIVYNINFSWVIVNWLRANSSYI